MSLEKKGIKCLTKILDDQAYSQALKRKLLEEIHEYMAAIDHEHQIEQLADIVEVIRALLTKNGSSIEDLEKVRQLKYEAKGGFNNQILLERTSAILNVPHSPSNCLFCRIGNQEVEIDIIAKFKYCFAIKDAYPVSKGHVLIIPFGHTDNWFTASEEVRQDMMEALQLLKIQLDSEYQPDGYNIGANCGIDAGQSVMHLHLHLIPRYKGDMEDPKGGVRGVIPTKQKY